MDIFDRLRYAIETYGAEAVLIQKTMLGSWDELKIGAGKSGYSVQTVDSLPFHEDKRNLTRGIGSIEDNYIFNMHSIEKIAKEYELKVIYLP
ncbi:hypothetical protein [uncultured Shewanella sp.]|uniref:hypothetical protein n=1 Tax=uncultured Shewanella sp. TaxID=173975 RepID=UPI002626FF92|nr:hypothetical protein [uncultured Shewanella sp.]